MISTSGTSLNQHSNSQRVCLPSSWLQKGTTSAKTFAKIWWPWQRKITTWFVYIHSKSTPTNSVRKFGHHHRESQSTLFSKFSDRNLSKDSTEWRYDLDIDEVSRLEWEDPSMKPRRRAKTVSSLGWDSGSLCDSVSRISLLYILMNINDVSSPLTISIPNTNPWLESLACSSCMLG